MQPEATAIELPATFDVGVKRGAACEVLALPAIADLVRRSAA